MTRRTRRFLRRAYASVMVAAAGWVYVTTMSRALTGAVAVAMVVLWVVAETRPRARRPAPRRPVTSRAARLEATPTHLYFWWDGPVLVYVGITNDADRRIDQHAGGKPWVRPGVVCELKATFPTRSAALAAEKAAIQVHRPRYNVQHAGRSWA